MVPDADGGPAVAQQRVDESYPLLRAAADDVVAFQAQRPISYRQFLADALALAGHIPARKYVLNLCTDRYRFMVGFAAALHRRQITLMPANDAPGTFAALARDYDGVYALADTARPALPTVTYPESLDPPTMTRFAVPVLPSDQAAVILFTSGSTGQPKPIEKSWGVLVRSALSAGKRLGVAHLKQAALIGTVPHQHSYGLESVILLALQHGLAVVAERPFFPADVLAALDAAPRPRILITTPVHIRSLATEMHAMPPLDLIVSATAPLSAALAAKAEKGFRAPLIEIYGCTEAGQIATRRTVNETQWRCLDDVCLEQRDGRSWVIGTAARSPTPLQDLIECDGTQTFTLAGRSADLVDIAGKHASLAHLNRQLLDIEGVQDGVFVMPCVDDRPMSRLAAVIVAPGQTPEQILGALRQRIDAAFLPRPLIMTDALPRNSLGKLPREAVLRLIRSRSV